MTAGSLDQQIKAADDRAKLLDDVRDALLTGGDPERSGEITADKLRALDPFDVPDAPEGSYAAITGCPT